MEDAGESPLEVLSRAATMVQQETQQATMNGDSAKSLHNQKQTTKWKRDRRRLPEYTRKSDPKIPETFGVEPSSPEASISNGSSLTGSPPGANVSGGAVTSPAGADTPLDMSVRQRGLPPSYAQTMSNPGYRSNYRPVVVTNGAVPTVRDELPAGISMCDPIIDEHFRRSLGNDYHTLFHNNNPSKDREEKQSIKPVSPPPKVTTNVVEMPDDTAMSVDDHFAKALGDTWAKLNKKNEEMKNGANESSLLSISN